MATTSNSTTNQPLIERTCLRCGKVFFVKAAYFAGQLRHNKGACSYCSRDCLRGHVSVHGYEERACVQCGKGFKVLKTQAIARPTSGRYCSKVCMDEYRRTQVEERAPTCARCGKRFTSYDKRRKYCSKACAQTESPSIAVNCHVCGIEYKVIPSKARTTKTCSRQCRRIYITKGRVVKECVVCGKAFSVYPCYIDRIRCCSRACGYIIGVQIRKENAPERSYHDYSFYRSREWADLRATVLERDGYRCMACGEVQRLHVHHIHRRIDSMDDSLGNLITLCGSCHSRVEARGAYFIDVIRDEVRSRAVLYYT